MFKKRIGVLLGGLSTERSVSLDTGRAISAALRRLGYDVHEIDCGRDLGKVLIDSRIDVVFNALHGVLGEDGSVQGLLEVAAIPYTGSKVTASAVAMNKVLTKILADNACVRTPRWVTAGDQKEDSGEPDAGGTTLPEIPFDTPWVVKPVAEGSSVGVAIVKNPHELPAAMAAAAGLHGGVMIEEFIEGREISVAVLNDEALGAVEIIPAEGFYDFHAKYKSEKTDYIYPAPISPTEYMNCCEHALTVHRLLGCEGVTRSDFILHASGTAYFLEINTLPGMTTHSLVPKIAAGNGLSFDELCERILLSASLGAKLPEKQ